LGVVGLSSRRCYHMVRVYGEFPCCLVGGRDHLITLPLWKKLHIVERKGDAIINGMLLRILLPVYMKILSRYSRWQSEENHVLPQPAHPLACPKFKSGTDDPFRPTIWDMTGSNVCFLPRVYNFPSRIHGLACFFHNNEPVCVQESYLRGNVFASSFPRNGLHVTRLTWEVLIHFMH
jgi:hypothetical protein